MKTATFFLAPAAVAAQWWGGAPDCAQDCLSSAWADASSSSAWPAPTNFCGGDKGASVSKCMTAACSATPTAWKSYSSLSSSVCGAWASCSAAGSTGTYTMTANNAAVTGTNGGYNNNGNGGVYTVTGCQWNGGSPWSNGPGGFGPEGNYGAGLGPWSDWGHGWKWSTYTTTWTKTSTAKGASATGTKVNVASQATTTTGTATVALAASGSVTNTHTLVAAQETNGAGANGVKGVGALLGAVVGVAALL